MPCPGIAGVPERLLMLQATQLYPDGSVVNFLDVPPGPNMQKTYLRLVNGQLNPTMTMRPGETQRWRILNATANVTYLPAAGWSPAPPDCQRRQHAQ